MNHRIIDVAKWSTLDIESKIKDKDLRLNDKDLESVIEGVVEEMEIHFDASIGVNWDVIDATIVSVICDMGLVPDHLTLDVN